MLICPPVALKAKMEQIRRFDSSQCPVQATECLAESQTLSTALELGAHLTRRLAQTPTPDVETSELIGNLLCPRYPDQFCFQKIVNKMRIQDREQSSGESTKFGHRTENVSKCQLFAVEQTAHAVVAEQTFQKS